MTFGPWFMMAVWALVLVGLSALCRHLLARALGRAFEYIVLPGTLVHELSHAVGCLITGARITSFALLEPDGGYVAHTEPKIPVVGQVVISLAPMVGCAAVLLFAADRLLIISGVQLLPSTASLDASGLGGFVEATAKSCQSMLRHLTRVDPTSLWTYLWAYLVASMAAMLGPSKQDIRNAALGVLAITLVLWLLLLGLRAIGAADGWIQSLPNWSHPGISVAVLISGLLALMLAAIRLLQTAFQALRHQTSRRPSAD